MRYLHADYPTEWLYKGTYPLQAVEDNHAKKVQSIKVYNLYAGIPYEFKVRQYPIVSIYKCSFRIYFDRLQHLMILGNLPFPSRPIV